MQNHAAIYGKVQIPRVYCEECMCWTLVIDGERQCGFHSEKEFKIVRYKRMSISASDRGKPRSKDQKELLEMSNYSCFYCFRSFGSWFRVKGKLRKLVVEWDHCVPYVWDRNNSVDNFVPACQICNRWKSSLIFRDIEEVRVYVATKWEKEERVSRKEMS